MILQTLHEKKVNATKKNKYLQKIGGKFSKDISSTEYQATQEIETTVPSGDKIRENPLLQRIHEEWTWRSQRNKNARWL
jgi:hypothetical protein